MKKEENNLKLLSAILNASLSTHGQTNWTTTHCINNKKTIFSCWKLVRSAVSHWLTDERVCLKTCFLVILTLVQRLSVSFRERRKLLLKLTLIRLRLIKFWQFWTNNKIKSNVMKKAFLNSLKMNHILIKILIEYIFTVIYDMVSFMIFGKKPKTLKIKN